MFTVGGDEGDEGSLLWVSCSVSSRSYMYPAATYLCHLVKTGCGRGSRAEAPVANFLSLVPSSSSSSARRIAWTTVSFDSIPRCDQYDTPGPTARDKVSEETF